MKSGPVAATSPIVEDYLAKTRSSAETYGSAARVLPGGNTRHTAFWKPYPLTIERARGYELWDVDGNRYIDLNNNYTALVHGYAYPPVAEAVREQIGRGSGWAAGSVAQVALAGQIVDRVPSIEQVRFTNSGTEAANLALAIARAVTGRDKALMARHGYHGSLTEFESGHMDRPWTMTHLADFNDAASFDRVLRDKGSEIAAVFLEPVLGAGGIIPATRDFLNAVMESARSAGAVFVLDEVLSFRLATGGLQTELGLVPDLTMLGKLIGGGYPVGAVGGRADIMKVLQPDAGLIFHGGTFNGNPITMVAGSVTLDELTAARIDGMGVQLARLDETLLSAANEFGLPLRIGRIGSLMNLHFSDGSPTPAAHRKAGRLASLFHMAALNRGVFMAPRGLIALSTVCTDAVMDDVADRLTAAMRDVADEF